MEIMYSTNKSSHFYPASITAFYGDALDLLACGEDVSGVIYDDEWTVKRFLIGFNFKKAKRINGIFKYLELDLSILNTKLKNLSRTDFKFVLLAYLLINNKKVLIFDYFEIGLTSKKQKKLINIIRNLKRDGFAIIFISKDLVFLNQFVDTILIPNENKIVYNGSIIDLFKNSEKVYEPEIIKFIKLANDKGANLEYTLDKNELLKDIYRSVC